MDKESVPNQKIEMEIKMSHATSSVSPSSSGRKRSSASEEAILAATHELLEEIGFNKLSIEGIASRAGVGKTTIYRWWPSKEVLAMEALLTAVAPTIEFPKTSSTCDDLMVQINKVARAYSGKTGRIVREMISLGQINDDVRASFVDGYLEPRRRDAKNTLQRGIERGELKSTIDLDVVVDALYGPIFHRMLCRHADINEEYVTEHVNLILSSISKR